MAQKNDTVDEILEFIWTKKEGGSVRREDLLKIPTIEVTEDNIERLYQNDYIYEVKGEINLTEKGVNVASRLVRAHRLTERLFMDVLEMEKNSMEQDACSLEHCLSQEAIEAICTLLGHPRECPHGRQIPQGECCKRTEEKIEPVVSPLNKL
ncbi:MAG: iron dependent repressor, metal binding and dimerization domain protein, partial [Desulfatiglandales bacterium]|nr:iron dependent repressor, metal binding and dimerization domain protein [Desulfatiglandales bacterium]